ncbi:hypothetical protein DSL72_000269 [Monilinia vaccinii-corymbosi]|uniref:Uncharacterized protein n=1 Tax=Monilinia vaccinii-corymbosi TaxID=61207 RepID=A0A8A3P635_9HELO|nr:hypothetical protein DSL72_000269 [Monilinia vaccinii-corymbosi]
MRLARAHDPRIPHEPQTAAHDGRDGKARDRQQQPVLAHPEDGLGVLAMPAVALDDVEEAPRVLAVFGGHEVAHAAGLVRHGAHVFDPEHGQEERPRAVHDGDVGHAPVAIVGLQGVDDAEEEGVLGHGAHGVVADSRGDGPAEPGGIAEEGVESSVAAVV